MIVIRGSKSVDGWFLGGLILLILSMYAYHAARMIAPLLGLYLLIIWLKTHYHSRPTQSAQLPHPWRRLVPTLILATLIALCLGAPFLFNLTNPQLTTRFSQTNLFSQIELIEASNQCRQAGPDNLFSRLICHRYLFFARAIAENFLSYFDPRFLFLTGDSNLRHSTGLMGIFFVTDAVLLVFGLIQLATQKGWIKYFLGSWLLIGLLPAAISLANPHALRILPTLPVGMLLLAGGANFLLTWWQKTWRQRQWPSPQLAAPILLVIIALLTFSQFSIWFYHYLYIYPRTSQTFWQVGYRQLISALSAAINSAALDPQTIVYLTREQGRPAMYYFFYQQIDPRQVQSQNATVHQDQGEFLEFNDQGQLIKFINSPAEVDLTKPALIAASPQSLAEFQPNASNSGQLQILGTSGASQLTTPIWQIDYYQPF